MPWLFRKIIPALFIIGLISCSETQVDSSGDKIAVTIAPYKNLVERIAGSKFSVISTIPSNATPHHFEPTPKLIGSIADADYYFSVGKYMEFEEVWLQKISGVSKTIKVIDLSHGINFINNDPHIWLSPSKLRIISYNILTELITIKPKEKEYFTKNFQSLEDSLIMIQKDLNASFKKIDNRILLTYHGSWQYFAEEFNFTPVSIEAGSKTSSAKEFGEIIKLVEQSQVPVIFIDKQHSKTAAKTIADDLGIRIDTLNPLPTNILENFYDIKNKINRYYR